MMLVGVDIGGTSIKAVLVDDALRIIRRTVRASQADGGPDAVIEQVHAAVAELLETRDDRAALQGIGVGAPGSVDAERGMLLHPPNLPGWDEVPLVSLVQGRWNVPVLLDNDANCAALGEARLGAGIHHSNFIALTLGTGVGSGIILNRKIHHGQHGFGGEFGHMTIDYRGPLCECGNTGCVEAFAGRSRLIARALERLQHHPESSLHRLAMDQPALLTPVELAAAAHAGDIIAREILFETGELIGVAVANAANLLDIPVFIIGGGIAASGGRLFDGIRASANRRVLRVHRDTINILPAELGNDAGMLGAAAMMTRE